MSEVSLDDVAQSESAPLVFTYDWTELPRTKNGAIGTIILFAAIMRQETDPARETYIVIKNVRSAYWFEDMRDRLVDAYDRAKDKAKYG